MQHLEQALQAAGKTFNQVDRSVVDYARGIGQMEAQSKTARGRIGEMTSAFVELSTQYNKMAADVQKGEVGQALSQSMDQLRQRIIAAKQELEGLNSQLANTKGPDLGEGGGGLFAGLGGKMSGALQVFGGNLLTKGAGMLAGLASEMGDMVKQGIELARQGEGIRIAFERLGRGDILDGLRQATHGTVTDLELMKAAVKFNDFNLPLSELGTMLAFAQQKAKDTGQSVDFLVESIVNGLGRKSLMILDNLGLSATEIKDRMAETGDMTKAVGDIIRDQMSKAGDYVETAADRAAQANVSLQNKMEELGRKFAPVEEASNQLWTSMKIGILDIVGGPLARLLNGLTEAGRLKNMLDDLNGGEDGKPTEVERQVNRVKTLKRAGGNERAVNTFASGIIEGYSRQIMTADKYVKQFEQDHSRVNIILDKASKELGRKFSSIEELKDFAKATGIVRDKFAVAVKDLTKPVDVSINTSKAEQNVETLRMKLVELEAQRKKAIEEGDQTQVKNLTQQINTTKQNIKALDPTAIRTTSHTASPQQRAEEKMADAQHTYEQAMREAALDLKAGTITQADAKKKELQAQQNLWKAIDDARHIYDAPGYKEAQEAAEQKIIELGGEVKRSTEAQKQLEQSTRDLQNAQKELAKYEKEAADAMSRNDLTGYLAAMEKVNASKNKVAQLTSPTDSHEEELAKARKVQSTPIAPKEFTITANFEEALAKMRKIESAKITPKEFVVTAETEDAMAKLREVLGKQVPDKEFIISANDKSLPLMQTIDGVSIQPKTFVVTAETEEAMAKLREVVNEEIGNKEFIISANDEEALAKARKIDSVKITPKEFVITADDEEALTKVQKFLGIKLAPKEITISANDEEALAKARKIDSVKITPKTFVVTAETEEAMSQLREVMGEQVPDKTFIISATDESLPLMQAIDGVSIQPKTFVVTAETDEAMSQLREVANAEIGNKEFIISANDEEALAKARKIDSVKITPKEFNVTANTDEAMAKLIKVVGAKISNKEFIISASDEEALAKARKIDSVKITPKEFVITADDEEALAKVQKFLGIKLAQKEFTISANDEEALAKARKIDSVKITPKTFVVTAETAEAMSQLREVMGEQVPDKTFIISATDESLPLMQAIAGVSIEPKTFSVTAETDDAMSQLREVIGEQVPDKEFIISATDESLPLMQAIAGVSIEPKTFSVTADTAEAMSQLREVVGEQVPDKTFIISATDESLPLMQAIDGVSIQPKTYVVTAETDDAMSQLREVMGEQIPDKTFIISATDEALPLMQAIEGIVITPKEFSVTANTEQAQESIKKLNVLSEQTEESLAKPRKPQGKQNATTPSFSLTQNNLQGFIANVQKQMGDTSLTTDLFGDLTSQLNDAKMLSSAIQTAIKNGLDPTALGLDNIWKQVFNINPGDYIDDSQWEELRKKLEESIGKPIEINFKTGEMKTLNNDAKTTEKSFREAASAVSSVSSALSQLEDPGAKIAGIIGQAIANIALGFAQATAASSGGGIFGWIAAIVGGMATMISTISAIHNATGYAEGGIVKGSTYSGDRVQALVDGVTPVGLNAGEVVLNHSQQATLAAELADRDNGGTTSSRPYVDAETIYLGVSNYLKRSGRGEILTTKNK